MTARSSVQTGDPRGETAQAGKRALHIVLTVNAAWNVWNFRQPVIAALIADGHRVTVLAPRDDSVPRIEQLGCRFVALPMNPQGMNPFGELALLWRLRAKL